MAAKSKVVHFPGAGGGEGPQGPSGGGPGDIPDHWSKKLVTNKDGDPKVSHHNVMTILEHHEDLVGMFRLDTFANRILICGDPPWNHADDADAREDVEFEERDATEVAAWLGQRTTYKMAVKPNLVMEAVEAVARRHAFNPVREYLDRREWDGEARLATMFADFFGAAQNDYTAAVAQIFMVSAVARIYDPGCKVDTMLVLEGPQGIGKTSATRDLFSIPWYAEAMESPNSKDFYQALKGKWGVEIGELSSFNKAEVHKVKQMLSAQFDTYRPSYGRYTKSFPRQCVFVGTTNEDDWNRDHTGARRFLPIRCTEIDVPALRKIRDQLWAEAVHRYKNGEAWGKLPADAELEQEARYQEDAWMEPIMMWLNCRINDDERYPEGVDIGKVEDRPAFSEIKTASVTEIMLLALKMDLGKHGRPEQMRVAAIMKRLGWKSDRPLHKDGTRRRVWVRPPAKPVAAAQAAPQPGGTS